MYLEANCVVLVFLIPCLAMADSRTTAHGLTVLGIPERDSTGLPVGIAQQIGGSDPYQAVAGP